MAGAALDLPGVDLSEREVARYLASLTARQRQELDAILFGTPDEVRAQSLTEFCEQVSPTWEWNWQWQQYVGDKFDTLRRRTHYDRMMLFVPPQHGKSELVTVRGAAQIIDTNPHHRVIVGAYSQFLANKFSRKTKGILRGRGHRFTADSVDDWETPEGGGGRYAGIDAGVTGAGAEAIGLDDPVKNRLAAESPTFRDRTYESYKDDFLTRLQPGGIMWLIMTRWHHDDLAGRILRSDEADDWHVVVLPALAEDNDPLGRAEGEALCPARFDRDALLRRQRVMRETFTAMYQQRPTEREGGIIKRHWFHYYAIPGKHRRKVQSWDTASKEKELNDPSVCTTWGQTLTAHQLLDVFRDRLEYPDLRRAVITQAERYNPDAILIEDKSSGTSLIQDLRNSTSLPIVAIEPEGDKVTRLSVESGFFESGLIQLPMQAPWLDDYVGELCTMPAAANDDQADSTSQYLRWAKHQLARIAHASTGRGQDALAQYSADAVEVDTDTGFGRLSRGDTMRGY